MHQGLILHAKQNELLQKIVNKRHEIFYHEFLSKFVKDSIQGIYHRSFWYLYKLAKFHIQVTMKTMNLVPWCYTKLTWRHVRMWLWLWAKWTSVLTIRVICPMFPTRVACFPAAGTVGCKITQIQLKDVLIDLNNAYGTYCMNSCMMYPFFFPFNSNKQENQDNWILTYHKRFSKHIIFLSIIDLKLYISD